MTNILLMLPLIILVGWGCWRDKEVGKEWAISLAVVAVAILLTISMGLFLIGLMGILGLR